MAKAKFTIEQYNQVKDWLLKHKYVYSDYITISVCDLAELIHIPTIVINAIMDYMKIKGYINRETCIEHNTVYSQIRFYSSFYSSKEDKEETPKEIAFKRRCKVEDYLRNISILYSTNEFELQQSKIAYDLDLDTRMVIDDTRMLAESGVLTKRAIFKQGQGTQHTTLFILHDKRYKDVKKKK